MVPGELFSGRLRNFVGALCYLTISVAYFKESACAMAILALRQNMSKEIFMAGVRKDRAITPQNQF